ncbi:MAG: sensor histidine kinase, partial [Tepidimonas sp.]|uniref:sensor histidine kinase n=1 Tax=Tepidimonas sp. TaxID=2002775 RepID=UPI004054C7CD
LRGEGGCIGVQRERDGATTHWRVTLLPDRREGSVAGVFVLLRDETALQRQQAALHDQHQDLQRRLQRQDAHLAMQQARWHALSAGLRDAAIFFLDADGAIQDWPASAERLLGYAAADVVGTAGPDAPQRPHPLPPDTAQALERASLLGQSEFTGWLRRADGSRLWAHLVYATLTGPDGEALGTACLVRDMTEVRRLEELLRDLNQALERKVEERTRQLQAANQDLEAFSYSVSHDLRAPLRHISAYVQLLREDLGEPIAPAVAEDLRTLEEATAHMGQLIEGLLAFARLGRAALHCQPIDMLDLLRSSLNRVRHDPALRRADGDCVLELPEALPAVDGDPLLLSQVWDNLLGNAFKYTRPRRPAVIAVGGEVRPGPDAAHEAVFWVRDNGVGFDAARADRLFGVFQRLHRAQDFEGTGIGLALCRRIIERHGGRIWADGRPGEGATFAFALPLRAAAQGHAA